MRANLLLNAMNSFVTNPRAELEDAQYQESRRRLLKFLARVAGDASSAEDALHESWVYLLSEKKRSVSLVSFAADRVGCEAMRFAHQIRRRTRREILLEFTQNGGEEAPAPVEPEAVGEDSIAKIVAEELAKCSLEERRLLLQRYGGWTSATSVSRSLGISKVSLLSKLKRARTKLRKAVAQRIARMQLQRSDREKMQMKEERALRAGAARKGNVNEQLTALRMVWGAGDL